VSAPDARELVRKWLSYLADVRDVGQAFGRALRRWPLQQLMHSPEGAACLDPAAPSSVGMTYGCSRIISSLTWSIIAPTSSERPGAVQPNSSVMRSIEPNMDLSRPSAAAKVAGG
jgi:hypothetical protein